MGQWHVHHTCSLIAFTVEILISIYVLLIFPKSAYVYKLIWTCYMTIFTLQDSMYIILNFHFTFSYVKQSTQAYVTKIKWTTTCHKIVNMNKNK